MLLKRFSDFISKIHTGVHPERQIEWSDLNVDIKQDNDSFESEAYGITRIYRTSIRFSMDHVGPEVGKEKFGLTSERIEEHFKKEIFELLYGDLFRGLGRLRYDIESGNRKAATDSIKQITDELNQLRKGIHHDN